MDQRVKFKDYTINNVTYTVKRVSAEEQGVVFATLMRNAPVQKAGEEVSDANLMRMFMQLPSEELRSFLRTIGANIGIKDSPVPLFGKGVWTHEMDFPVLMELVGVFFEVNFSSFFDLSQQNSPQLDQSPA